MKKFMSILVIMGLASAVFADEISALYKEFQRRDAITLTKEQGRAFAFLRSLKYEATNVKSMEFIDPSNPDKFLIESINGDICLADISTDLLRCKNSMGITTINFSGDAD